MPLRVELELLNLARQRVAAQAQQVRSLDAPAARVRERAQDQRLLELTRQLVDDGRLTAIERDSASRSSAAIQFCCARARCSRRAARGGRSLTSTFTARRHHGEPVAQILQLPHVAGQVLRTQDIAARLPTGAWPRRRARGALAAGNAAREAECPRAARAATAGAAGSRSGGETGPRGTAPACTRVSRSWWVAAITRTLALIGWWPPTR